MTTAQPSSRQTRALLPSRVTSYVGKRQRVKPSSKSLSPCSGRRLVRLEGDGWHTFFDSYQREAFRLETLPSYGVSKEHSGFEKFLGTGELDIPDDDPWLVRVRHFRHTGRWIGRVHVISRPLTDYLRYEFAVYRRTVEAGEDVRILDPPTSPIQVCPRWTSGSSMTSLLCAWTMAQTALSSDGNSSKTSTLPHTLHGNDWLWNMPSPSLRIW